MITEPCFECVSEEEYLDYVLCWFDKNYQCGDNIKAELRSSFLMIKRMLTNSISCCSCDTLCSPCFKEAVYIQTYFKSNHDYSEDSKVKLTAEAYDYMISNGLIYA